MPPEMILAALMKYNNKKICNLNWQIDGRRMRVSERASNPFYIQLSDVYLSWHFFHFSIWISLLVVAFLVIPHFPF